MHPRLEERTGRPLPIRMNSNHGWEGETPRSACPPADGRAGPTWRGTQGVVWTGGYGGGRLLLISYVKF